MKTSHIPASLAAAAIGFVLISSGQAAPANVVPPIYPEVTRAPWPLQRPLILLPLQFGPGWNLTDNDNQEKLAKLLPIAEQKLQQALQKTGKLSTTQLHRYNPILRRGVQEKNLTRETMNSIIANPTVEGLQRALATMRFDHAPLIAEFFMEEVTTQYGTPSPVVMSQVTGRLYEVNNPIAVKTVVVTSDPVPLYLPRKVGKKTLMVRRSTSDRLLMAADNSFVQIAREFTKPLDDIMLPEPVETEMPVAPQVQPSTPDGVNELILNGGTISIPRTGKPKVIEVPAGQVLGTFQVPAPKK